jgi:flagellar biosynthesis protein FlhF
LKTYAEILNIPVQVVYSPNEISDAVDKFKDKDIILVDTAGRSHRKKSQMEELKKIVEMSQANEVFLVISANTRVKDYKEIIETYGFLEDYKLVITKIDETNSVGNVLNLKYYSNKPLTYITTGQSVPDDIEVINADKLTRCIMGSMRYDGSG